ncbi:uncharacterized protein TRIREDRAFT_122943 [Trichoderma reesei QM6a]|uniref:Predicted protein n=2 Tax=Hypocrea jecorina TaxID=51453 RepID=G0RPP4_HYPJQ|nr:uncharacterized protein TRIREDRAFT_122943 [Trichoderma reesei QM6a]EGR46892.1 predicted protein [Trichoderma reesei QM6a]ETS00488.1 hypothetical protein M419DRAFT_124027 [Trichoderma reesei RUT C-30]
MSYVDNLSGQFGELGLGASQSHQPPPPSGQHDNYGYHSANRDDAPPAQFYASPPQPTYQPPSDKPPLPQGWIPLFDQSRQRWYYANQETGVTQWEAPGYVAPPPRPPMETYPSEDSRGSGHSPYPPAVPYGHTPGGYSAPPGPPPSASYGAPPPMPPAGYGAPAGEYGGHGEYGGQGEEEKKKKKKSSGSSGLLLGAAGGVAAGLVGGALLHHALEDDSSSDEERPHYAPQPVIINEYNNDYDNDYSGGPPAVLPTTDADGNSVSSSDRESVQEAREEYEEALADVQDSDASSSDYEELEEAREEYEEEYEETYED